MASPALADLQVDEAESDYGSDFSPEDQEIVNSLLSAQTLSVEDNPIVSNVEYPELSSTLRVPRVLGQRAEEVQVVSDRVVAADGERLGDPSISHGMHDQSPYGSRHV